MRTIHFPIENESPETLKYLLDTVLPQNGSIVIEKSACSFEVIVMADPNEHGYYWGDPTYIVRLVRMPKNMRYTRAKFVGIATKDIAEVKDIILGYNPEDEDSTERFPKKKSTPKKVYRKSEPEVIPERPMIDDWRT